MDRKLGGLLWTTCERENSWPYWDSNSDPSARSQSLYQLSYPGSHKYNHKGTNYKETLVKYKIFISLQKKHISREPYASIDGYMLAPSSGVIILSYSVDNWHPCCMRLFFRLARNAERLKNGRHSRQHGSVTTTWVKTFTPYCTMVEQAG
jgi:hypothetical protein